MIYESLVPTQWDSYNKPFYQNLEYPFLLIDKNADKIFNNLNTAFSQSKLFKSFSSYESNNYPKVDILENKNEYIISAELPGIDAKNIDVSLDDGTLIIKGEKKIEKEREKEAFYNQECYYGAFQRIFELAETIDQSKISANFDKGVLTVKLLKASEQKKYVKKIPINN